MVIFHGCVLNCHWIRPQFGCFPRLQQPSTVSPREACVVVALGFEEFFVGQIVQPSNVDVP